MARTFLRLNTMIAAPRAAAFVIDPSPASLAGLTVAVIGLDSMGGSIAKALLHAGATVQGYDADTAARSGLREHGGMPATDAGHAVNDAQVVIAVVVNAEQTERVLFGAHGCLAQMAEGAVFVSCTTMSPSDARALAQRVEAAGRLYLDAPISGGSQRAAEGTLSILVSGAAPAYAKAEPALKAMAATIHRLGDKPGQAAAFKMVNQLLAGVHVAAAAEAMAFAANEGLDLTEVYRVITQSAGNSWMFENRVPHVLDGDYTPRSATSLFVKDLGIVLEMGQKNDFPLPLSTIALQLFMMTSALGMDRDDDASVIRLYAQLAGLQLPPATAGTTGQRSV